MHTISGSNPIPTELVIIIFGELSLSDALHLAATCHRLHQILDENTGPIYKRLRRRIQCEKYARVLLEDQGGLASDSYAVTIQDLLRMRRNFRIVENSILVFDREITQYIRVPGPWNEFYIGKPRPLHLTPTERHRFTRTYYQTWSLFLLDQPSRQQRYASMLLKHLYMVYEMVQLDYRAGDETETIITIEKHREVIEEVDAYLRHLYHHIHGAEYLDFSGLSVEMRTRGNAAIWDHCQSDLKFIVCRLPWGRGKQGAHDEEVWEDTTDEE